MTDMPVRRIAHIDFTGNSDEKQITLAITGDDGETRAYNLDPATLRAFIAPMISLMASWSGDPELRPQDLTGTQNALRAQKIMFNRGRDNSEGAVRLFLGKDIDLTFLMPLSELVPAFKAFEQKLTFTPPPGTTTN